MDLYIYRGGEVEASNGKKKNQWLQMLMTMTISIKNIDTNYNLEMIIQ